MKTIAQILARHGATDSIIAPNGSRAVRDSGQHLWFYYRWNGKEYQLEGSTRKHPKFQS